MELNRMWVRKCAGIPRASIALKLWQIGRPFNPLRQESSQRERCLRGHISSSGPTFQVVISGELNFGFRGV
jgi:hypothetical protein